MKKTLILDKKATEVFEEFPNAMIAWYLLASYAYYIENNPILTDGFFDNLAKTILERYDELEHIHKHLVTKEDLEAGTYLGEYPDIIQFSLQSLREIKL